MSSATTMGTAALAAVMLGVYLLVTTVARAVVKVVKVVKVVPLLMVMATAMMVMMVMVVMTAAAMAQSTARQLAMTGAVTLLAIQ
jgi:hypothetical protein